MELYLAVVPGGGVMQRFDGVAHVERVVVVLFLFFGARDVPVRYFVGRRAHRQGREVECSPVEVFEFRRLARVVRL